MVCQHSYQLLLNKIFDPSAPSMRKDHDRGEERGKNGGEKREENKDIFSDH